LTGGVAPLFAPGSGDLAHFLEHAHDLYDRWGESLEAWLRGEPWPTRQRSEEGARRFGAAMRAMGAQVAARFADIVDLTDVRTVLDVGGGFGHYARALCRVNTGVEVTVLDTPHVVALAEAERPQSGLEHRVHFVAGDYLSSDYGSGFDLALFASVLHQEVAANAEEMIRRAAGALGPGGRVAVLDFCIDEDQHGPVLGALFAINMRSFGDTHTEPAVRGFMEAAGLVDVTRTGLGRHRWIIEGRKPT
jgi:SAM-dependent methyltransferase